VWRLRLGGFHGKLTQQSCAQDYLNQCRSCEFIGNHV
jgi:hypothetical protein